MGGKLKMKKRNAKRQRYDDDVSNPPKRARIDEDAPPQQLKTKKSARIDEDASPVATNSKVKRRGIPIPTQPASTSNNPTPARVKDDIWDGLPYIAVVDAKRMERIAELCESNDFGGLRDEVFTGPMKNFIDRRNSDFIESAPNYDEMPEKWPGIGLEKGLRSEHLYPDVYKVFQWDNRDDLGNLRNSESESQQRGQANNETEQHTHNVTTQTVANNIPEQGICPSIFVDGGVYLQNCSDEMNIDREDGDVESAAEMRVDEPADGDVESAAEMRVDEPRSAQPTEPDEPPMTPAPEQESDFEVNSDLEEEEATETVSMDVDFDKFPDDLTGTKIQSGNQKIDFGKVFLKYRAPLQPKRSKRVQISQEEYHLDDIVEEEQEIAPKKGKRKGQQIKKVQEKQPRRHVLVSPTKLQRPASPHKAAEIQRVESFSFSDSSQTSSLSLVLAFPNPTSATKRFINDFVKLKDCFKGRSGFENRLNCALRALFHSHDIPQEAEMVETCQNNEEVAKTSKRVSKALNIYFNRPDVDWTDSEDLEKWERLKMSVLKWGQALET